jgi:hypothetical protein
LLKAASEILGSDRALASRLGIGEALLAKFMADLCELPDPLLLRAVDVILEDRQSRFHLADLALAPEPQNPQNCGRGSGAALRNRTGGG